MFSHLSSQSFWTIKFGFLFRLHLQQQEELQQEGREELTEGYGSRLLQHGQCIYNVTMSAHFCLK